MVVAPPRRLDNTLKAERLMKLLATLMDANRPLTRDELTDAVGMYAEGLQARRKRFGEDCNTLRSLGVPVETVTIDSAEWESGYGYRVDKVRYELPDPDLDEFELAALHLAVHTVGTDEDGRSALRKLGGGSPDLVATPDATAELPDRSRSREVFAAVTARRRLRFGYRGVERLVDPWTLSFSSGHWYLDGWDHKRKAPRQFRLDRMDGDPVAEGPNGAFERPTTAPGGAPPPWLLDDSAPELATLWVEHSQAAVVTDACRGRYRHISSDDQGVTLEIPVSYRPGFRSFVLGLLDHAEVLGPPAIRNDVVTWLQCLAGEESQ